MARTPYPSDLTDSQWQILEPFILPERWGGRTRSVNMRKVLNGILYLLRSGCAWLCRYRRLSENYEYYLYKSETMIYLAMINLMLHRLVPGRAVFLSIVSG